MKYLANLYSYLSFFFSSRRRHTRLQGDWSSDVCSSDLLSSTLLGLTLKYPIMIAPTATQVALHPDGEAGMYRAAALSSNTPVCLSNNSSQSVEQVAKGAQGQLWWQFYPRQDMGASQELLERAQAAGYTAMVITVDQQASYYERSQHDRNLGARAGGAGRGGGRGAAAGAARQG